MVSWNPKKYWFLVVIPMTEKGPSKQYGLNRLRNYSYYKEV